MHPFIRSFIHSFIPPSFLPSFLSFCICICICIHLQVLERLPDTLKQTAPSFGRAVAAAIGAARWLAEKDPAVQRKVRPMLVVLAAAEKAFAEQQEDQELYRVVVASRWLRQALNSGS
jgi:hypothetical protein